MNAHRQVFLDNLTAATAHLRGVGGVHKRNVTTSIYRFVAQQRLERTESSIVSGQGQVQIVGHERQGERFESNQAKGTRQPKGQFVPEVAALVGDMFMQPRDN